jgi:membrane protein DedA with SNARE-associated domain
MHSPADFSAISDAFPKEAPSVGYLDRFLEFLNSLPDLLIYVALGLSAFIENVFPPIPGDTITAFGAFLVGTKRLQFLGVYLSTTVGSLCGFMSLFWLGRLLGRRYFVEKDHRFFRAQDILRAEQWFRRFGYLLILLNRFLPGIRSVISISGGISGLATVWVTLLALVSCSVYNLIWIYFGHLLGSNWETAKDRMAHILTRYNVAVLVVLGLLVLGFLLKRRLGKKGSPGTER